jgi:predicted ribosomally synthesized peptide with SipW-like signal peptide
MPNQRRSSRLMFLALIGAVVTAIGGAAMSLAYFTDTDTVDANTFTTGTIVLTTSPTTALVTYSAMFPGDSVTAALTVSNTGSGDLRYAMTSASTNTDSKALKDQLTLVVKTQGTNCTTFDGTTVYTGTLASAAFGNTLSGSQTGDRPLSASTNEVLCFKVALDSGTGNAYQNATTTTTFTFVSEQTQSNP